MIVLGGVVEGVVDTHEGVWVVELEERETRSIGLLQHGCATIDFVHFIIIFIIYSELYISK